MFEFCGDFGSVVVYWRWWKNVCESRGLCLGLMDWFGEKGADL